MKKCKVCGRETKVCTKGMCSKHYAQFKKYGKVLDNNPRTIKDPNEVVYCEDYAEIILYNINSEEIARAQIDLEDVEKIIDIKWRLHEGYCQGIDKMGGRYKLHRLLMDCPEDKIIDHVDRNPLNNRKENLRVCTQVDNVKNKSKASNNTSGVVGVRWHKWNKKWVAYIGVKGKTIHLGYFDTMDDAIEIRRRAEKEYFKEFNPNRD